MLGNGGYAMKKRKKPVQKNLKAPSADGAVKSNPSKRHRDRLNGELERLTSLLPFSEEVRGRLDKLSVLRLSVGYLKVKSYFHASLQKNACPAPSLAAANNRNGQTSSLDGVTLSEGDLLLQALNGFVLVVMADGSIFYTSPTIQDYLGFHQSDVVHQSVYDLIHMDDRDTFRCQLHFAFNPGESDGDSSGALQPGAKAAGRSQTYLPQHIPPENSSFLERSFCCRFRCLLDNSSGFLAMNFQGRLKFLHGQSRTTDNGTMVPSELALFAIATPMQPPSVMEIRTKTLFFQTKHRMDFAPMGIDTRGKLVLGYSETELITPGSGYQFIHAADMMYCADNHIKMIKTGESGLTVFRLLTKRAQWVWVQANARIVFKAGRPDFIIARQKALTNEEGEEHLRQRRLQLPFNFANGEGVLYDACLSLDSLTIPGLSGADAPVASQSGTEEALNPASLLGAMLRQDRSIYNQPQQASPQEPVFPPEEDSVIYPKNSLEQAFLDSHALLSVPSQLDSFQNRSSLVDPTSETMLDSLEQILGEIGDGGEGDLKLGETDLRDWESALFRVNMEREEVSRELDELLANDVFSYVEEALKREAGGCLKSTVQTGPRVGNETNNFTGQPLDHFRRSMLPGSQGRFNSYDSPTEDPWQLMEDISPNLSDFGEQNPMGNALSVVSGFTPLKRGTEVVMEAQRPVHRLTHTQSNTSRQGDGSQIWPPSREGYLCGSQVASEPLHDVDQSPPALSEDAWIPPIQGANTLHNSHCPDMEVAEQNVQYSPNYTGTNSANVPTAGQSYTTRQLQGPTQPWQHTQWHQPPHGLHHHTLIHSQSPLCGNSPVQSVKHKPQIQSSTGSCMFDKRGHIPPTATVPIRQNGPVLSPACTTQPPVTGLPTRTIPFTSATVPATTLSHQGMTTAVRPVSSGASYQGMKQLNDANPQMGPYADVGSIHGSQLGGETSNLTERLPGFPPENGMIQASYFCWNGETQISNGPPNGGAEPFTFSALPTDPTNVSPIIGP